MIHCSSYDEAKLEAIHVISEYDNCVKEVRIGYNKKIGWYVKYEEFEIAEREELYI